MPYRDFTHKAMENHETSGNYSAGYALNILFGETLTTTPCIVKNYRIHLFLTRAFVSSASLVLVAAPKAIFDEMKATADSPLDTTNGAWFTKYGSYIWAIHNFFFGDSVTTEGKSHVEVELQSASQKKLNNNDAFGWILYTKDEENNTGAYYARELMSWDYLETTP